MQPRGGGGGLGGEGGGVNGPDERSIQRHFWQGDQKIRNNYIHCKKIV